MTIGFSVRRFCGTRKRDEGLLLITRTKEKAGALGSGLEFTKLVAGVGFEPTTFGL